MFDFKVVENSDGKVNVYLPHQCDEWDIAGDCSSGEAVSERQRSDMSATDLTVGYPVHAVASYRNWTNQHGALFMDWTATCGATGTESGHNSFKTAVSARKRELCWECWPNGHRTFHPSPERI